MLCERFATCVFYTSHKNRISSREYELLIQAYCEGALQPKCKRYQYWLQHATAPPPDLSPTGYKVGTLSKLYG